MPGGPFVAKSAIHSVCWTNNDFNQIFSSSANKMKMQISTLKTILKTDEQHFKDWIKEILAYKKIVKVLVAERDELRMDNHNCEINLEDVKEELVQIKEELLNEKNTMQHVSSEAKSLEVQLDKEREKMKKLKDELKVLSNKVLNLEKKHSSKSVRHSKLKPETDSLKR